MRAAAGSSAEQHCTVGMGLTLLVLLLGLGFGATDALDNGLARTP
jgi:hypothetical protein